MGLLLAATGCEFIEIADDTVDTDTDVVPGPLDPTEIDPGGDPTQPIEVDPLTTDASGWTWGRHPCVGHRTDTMVRDANDRYWIGCGSTAEGNGLFYSDDEGQTWLTPVTEPAAYFDRYRVNDLWIAPSGLLYAAGRNTGIDARNRDGIVAVSTTLSPTPVDTVFEIGDEIWNSFPVGTYRADADGVEVAESLTGIDLMIREPGGPWENGVPWTPSGEGFQLLDMEVHDGDLYGCGSTINQPPTVFVPIPEATIPFVLQDVPLASSFTGELWDLVVDDRGVLAVGVDQDADVGILVMSDGGDPQDPSSYSGIRLDSWFSQATWLQGVCRRGDEIVAVGRYSRTDNALALRSTDGGQSWEDITPDDTPALYVCEIREDGRLVVTGAEGVFGVRTP
jgi:hypothetical protein